LMQTDWIFRPKMQSFPILNVIPAPKITPRVLVLLRMTPVLKAGALRFSRHP